MKIEKLGVALVLATLSVAGANTQVLAASDLTNVFLNNVEPNVDFLDRSSRTALTNSTNPRIKAFAYDQAKTQTLAANALDGWIEADKKAMVADNAPLQTGRSVAVDGQTAQPIVDNRLPLGQEDLDRIEGLNGSEFDTQYKQTQLNAMNQMRADYKDYIANGDDPALKAIATRELPKLEHNIAALKKM